MSADQLPHLETFARAAELSCFTSAARVLGLTQAAVSQRIQALEGALGVSLFQRHAGRVVLTDAGQRLYSFAERILALHREAVEEVSGQKVPLTGELSLAASSVPGEHLLPDLLSAFRSRQPHVQVRASVTDTETVLRQVEHGEAHLGLVGGKTDHPELEFRCFATDRLVLVVPAGHPWRRRRRVTLAALAEQPLIVREAGSGTRWCLERALAQAGQSLRDMRVALELGSNQGIKEAVLRGLGLAFLSSHAVADELRTGALRAVQVAGLTLSREMFVVWGRRRALPITARLFLDLLPFAVPGIGP
ncbi:MAG TPA: LysR family transcriptional regulator [Gemmataceae bacterium]|nr:LysR family transcriptional regulator [Gemmataceae bacterium]